MTFPMAMPGFLLKLGDLDREALLRSATERAPMFVAVLLVLAIAALFARNVLKLLAPPPSPAAMAALPATGPSSIDVGAIVNAHLFGTAASSAAGLSSAPATSMNLFLAGTIAGPEPENGWAIIGENAQSARVVATGSSVTGGILLKAVYPDRVVLEQGGRLESLTLPRLSGATGAYPAANSEANAMLDAVRNAIGNQAAVAKAGEIVRPQPVFANGALRGVRAYPGANRQAFGKLGLQPGDLVTAINGAQLDDVQRATATLRNLGNEPVQLTVIRNGEARQITVDPTAVATNGASNAANSDEEPPMSEP